MLQISLLGGAHIFRPGRAIPRAVFHRHRLALLTLLVLNHPRPVRRRKLAGLLWPESDDAHARNLLNQAVFVLRHGLGEDLISSTPQSLLFNGEGATVDYRLLQHALEAGDSGSVRNLYRAPLLDGFFLDGASEFDNLIEAHRSSLHHRVLRLLRTEAAQFEKRGDFDDAVDVRAQLLTLDPLDEEACLALMHACCRAGHRAAALQHAYAYFDRTARLFDLPPDPAVLRMIEVIRTQGEASVVGPIPREASRSPHLLNGSPASSQSASG